ncbi:heavy metal translocatin [Aureobasidium pullulans]|uniref:Heavy metal translocatin n=2 Tax=Aureobasidium TaxID=5579 RepID=A0A4S9BXE1_AURPU
MSSGCCPSESSDDERCSGEICDGTHANVPAASLCARPNALFAEKCISAAAAVECRAACDHEALQGADPTRADAPYAAREHHHAHDAKDHHQSDACSTHLKAAFDRYTQFLEQALCVCKRVQAEISFACDGAKLAQEPGRVPKTSLHASCSTSAVERLPHAKARHRHAARGKHCGHATATLTPALKVSSDGCCAVEKPIDDCCDKEPTSDSCGKKPIDDRCASDIQAGGCCTTEKAPHAPHPGSGGCRTPKGQHQAVFSHRTRATAAGDVEKQAPGTDPVTFSVAGMDCSGCGNILARAFDGVPGVTNVNVTFINGTATCDIDTRVIDVNEVLRLVERATKYKLTVANNTYPTLDIVMDTATAQQLSHDMPNGVLDFNPISKRHYSVTYDDSVIGARALMAAMPGASLAPPSQDASLTAGQVRLRNVFWATLISFVLTIPVVVLSWADPPLSEHTILYISIVLATLVQGISVTEFYRPALSALIYNRVVEMDMLVVISITAAYGYSIVAFALILSGEGNDTIEPLFETSTLLISLILLGRLVAAYARKRAVAAVSLRSLQSATATLVVDNESSMEVDARLLEIGDTILIGPHSQIVTDGLVSAGASDVDESMITGEALPIPKIVGDAVVAGTLNQGGALSVVIGRLPGKNTVTDIADLVEQAQSKKPRVQDLADKVAGFFIPVVVTVSIIVTIIWVVVELKVRNRSAGRAVGNAITYGVAVLAISCPCALGLAVPMVLVISGGVAARMGIIVKTADVVERGFRCTDVIFDKTGTLTENTLDIVAERIFGRDGFKTAEILGLVRAMATGNGHPISRMLELALANRGIAAAELDSVESIPGAGVQTEWNGKTIRGGNPHWLQVDQVEDVSRLASQGLAMYCVADDSGLLAVFGLKTSVRTEAQYVVQELHSRQISVHVVSGDGTVAVEAVASELGIPLEHVASRQKPEDKQNYIRRLKDAGKTVLFCGDGTNDAVAVAEAHVGVQIESSSDVTRATADVILLGDLKGVPILLDISKAAFHRILFNFLWAALYNVFAILLASGAFVYFRIPPAYAGLGELVSVLPVVITAATLLMKKFA